MLLGKRKISLGLVAVMIVAVIAFTHPKGRWLVDTLLLKMGGDLPEYT